jgi:hypothetical protein
LISVSVAPGSYFFCALAGPAIAAIANNTTAAVAPWIERSDIVFSLSFICFIGEVSQPRAASASSRLFRKAEHGLPLAK